MKIKRSRKFTNKDTKQALQEIQFRLMSTQSQVNNLIEIFSEFLEFTHKKAKFMEHLESKTKRINSQEKEEAAV